MEMSPEQPSPKNQENRATRYSHMQQLFDVPAYVGSQQSIGANISFSKHKSMTRSKLFVLSTTGTAAFFLAAFGGGGKFSDGQTLLRNQGQFRMLQNAGTVMNRIGSSAAVPWNVLSEAV